MWLMLAVRSKHFRNAMLAVASTYLYLRYLHDGSICPGLLVLAL
jgi:hypothetical protein